MRRPRRLTQAEPTGGHAPVKPGEKTHCAVCATFTAHRQRRRELVAALAHFTVGCGDQISAILPMGHHERRPHTNASAPADRDGYSERITGN